MSLGEIMPPSALSAVEFACRMPKAELHVHIEGTLEPDLAFALARRNGLTLPFANEEALHAAKAFTDLQSFLDLYYACADVLRTSHDFADLMLTYLGRAHADGVVHAEIFFDPHIYDEFFAIGSGSSLALGAMSFGASAEEAVRVAIKHNVFCGGEVYSVSLG